MATSLIPLLTVASQAGAFGSRSRATAEKSVRVSILGVGAGATGGQAP